MSDKENVEQASLTERKLLLSLDDENPVTYESEATVTINNDEIELQSFSQTEGKEIKDDNQIILEKESQLQDVTEEGFEMTVEDRALYDKLVDVFTQH